MLGNAKIIDQLELAPRMLRDPLGEVPAGRLKSRPAEGKWSAHEHALHLGEVEALFSARLDSMLAEEDPAVMPYTLPAQDERGALLMADLGRALDKFEAQRERLVQRLRTLGDAEWKRSARHPEYLRYNVRVMFRHAALHDMLHCYRIEELLLKKDRT